MLLKYRFWFSRSGVGSWDPTYLASSQVILILPVHEPHLARLYINLTFRLGRENRKKDDCFSRIESIYNLGLDEKFRDHFSLQKLLPSFWWSGDTFSVSALTTWRPPPLPWASNWVNLDEFESGAIKWRRKDTTKELNLLGSTVQQAQANAEGVDLAPRVNTILFSRTICYIRLAQAEGHRGRWPPSPSPSSLPFPLSPPFAASLPPLIGWPQTLSFPWDFLASAFRLVAADASRLSRPGPQRQARKLKGTLREGEPSIAICAAVSLDKSGSRKGSFVFFCLFFSSSSSLYFSLYKIGFLSFPPFGHVSFSSLPYLDICIYSFLSSLSFFPSSSFVFRNSISWNW